MNCSKLLSANFDDEPKALRRDLLAGGGRDANPIWLLESHVGCHSLLLNNASNFFSETRPELPSQLQSKRTQFGKRALFRVHIVEEPIRKRVQKKLRPAWGCRWLCARDANFGFTALDHPLLWNRLGSPHSKSHSGFAGTSQLSFFVVPAPLDGYRVIRITRRIPQ